MIIRYNTKVIRIKNYQHKNHKIYIYKTTFYSLTNLSNLTTFLPT
jgi:hypothetical protein